MTTEKMLSFSVFVVRLADVKGVQLGGEENYRIQRPENASSKNKERDSGRGGDNGLPARVLRR